MLEQDITALKTRFLTSFSLSSQQVLVSNQPVSGRLDKSQPYVRFVVSPASSRRVEQGPSAHYHQVGTVILQVIAPNGSGDAKAYQLRNEFANLFRDWKSPDGKLLCGQINDDMRDVPATSDEAGYLMLTCTVYWRSSRQL